MMDDEFQTGSVKLPSFTFTGVYGQGLRAEAELLKSRGD